MLDRVPVGDCVLFASFRQHGFVQDWWMLKVGVAQNIGSASTADKL